MSKVWIWIMENKQKKEFSQKERTVGNQNVNVCIYEDLTQYKKPKNIGYYCVWVNMAMFTLGKEKCNHMSVVLKTLHLDSLIVMG